jgi:SpoVK/Ycf46/Vps4 family AAA+-type ATPase
VARSDLVKALLRTYRQGDDRGFRSTAEALIEDERRKRHDLLANELEAILDEPSPGRRPLQVSALRPLPKGRDDVDLLELLQPTVSLQQVVLAADVAEIVEGLIDEFRQRSTLRAHGLDPRSTVLFVGPPGCGKSLTAEAIAGELGIGMARVRLAAVVSSYLGETAKNLEQIFAFLRSGSWVLLFDEFDMLARERGDRVDHGEVRRIVTALLQLVEDSHTDSMIIATTNHPQLLDVALWRRFDEVVELNLPRPEDRTALLEMNLRTVRAAVDLRALVARTEGYTHAEIEQLCRDAMRLMVRSFDRSLSDRHVDYAVSRREERRRAMSSSRD